MARPASPETSSGSSEDTDSPSIWTDSESQSSSEEPPAEGPSGHPLPEQNESEAFKEPDGRLPSHPSQDELDAPTALSEDLADKSSTEPPEAMTTVPAPPAEEDRSPTDMFLSEGDKETWKEILSSLDKCGKSKDFKGFVDWSSCVGSIWGGVTLQIPDCPDRTLSTQEALIRFSGTLSKSGFEVSDRENIATLGDHFAETFPAPSIERDRTAAWMQGELEALIRGFEETLKEKSDEFTGKKPPQFQGFKPTLLERWNVVVEPSLADVPEEDEDDSSKEDITVYQDTEQCVRTGPSTDMPGPPANTLPNQTRVTQVQAANPPSAVRTEYSNAPPARRSMSSFVTDSTAQNSTMTSESNAEKDQRPAKRLKSSLAADDKLQDHTTSPATTSTSQGLDSTLPEATTTSTLATTSPPRRRKVTAMSGSSAAVHSTAPPEASQQNPQSTVPEKPAGPTDPPAETKPSSVSPQSERLTFELKNDTPASVWLNSFRTMFDNAKGMERQLAPTTWLGEPRTFEASKGDYECTGTCESNGRLFNVTCDVRRGNESLWRTQQAWNMVGEGGYQFRVDWIGKNTPDADEPSTSELYKEFSQVVQDTGLADLPWPAPFKMEGANIWDDGNVDHGELPWTLLPPLEQTANTLVS